MPVLDVRSPGEFRQGHLERAVNLPLFTDEQRAEIGTAYKKSGRQLAVIKGLGFISARLSDLVEQAIGLANTNEVLVHCWRGGMRSQSLAQILNLAELRPHVLDGGYKSFRKYARSFFELPYQLQVVSGLTGAGKTKVLQLLEQAGEQVIDLERLANHRGSAFGGIGQGPQPTTEQFENDLFVVLERIDLSRPVWIEDEGNRIGSVVVPSALYERLRNSPAVCIECSPQQRLENLLADYGGLPAEQLIHAIGKISKRLDGPLAKQAVAAIEANDIAAAIEISLAYYDKTYRAAMVKMPRQITVPVDVESLTDEQVVAKLSGIAQGR